MVCFIVDLQKCTGCQACEMACSYHFTKELEPTNSAIKTFRENSIGEIKTIIDKA